MALISKCQALSLRKNKMFFFDSHSLAAFASPSATQLVSVTDPTNTTHTFTDDSEMCIPIASPDSNITLRLEKTGHFKLSSSAPLVTDPDHFDFTKSVLSSQLTISFDKSQTTTVQLSRLPATRWSGSFVLPFPFKSVAMYESIEHDNIPLRKRPKKSPIVPLSDRIWPLSDTTQLELSLPDAETGKLTLTITSTVPNILARAVRSGLTLEFGRDGGLPATDVIPLSCICEMEGDFVRPDYLKMTSLTVNSCAVDLTNHSYVKYGNLLVAIADPSAGAFSVACSDWESETESASLIVDLESDCGSKITVPVDITLIPQKWTPISEILPKI
jgi:hypothetical protein